MKTTVIETKVARAIELKQQIAGLTDELKDITSALKDEAASRPEEHTATEGEGWSWRHTDAEGHIVCVTQPGPKLKGTINPEAKGFDKIKEAAGRAWSVLFYQVPAYKPMDDFRNLAVAHLGRDAKKLIKLVSSESAMQVTFEVAERSAA